MTDHEFLTIVHHEFEEGKETYKKQLEALLKLLESRYDIQGLFAKGYAKTLTGDESRALRLYQNINDQLKRH